MNKKKIYTKKCSLMEKVCKNYSKKLSMSHGICYDQCMKKEWSLTIKANLYKHFTLK